MPDIESISILRQSDRLDKVSKSKTPLFVTKNGRAYLVVMSPESYEEIVKEREHYKEAFAREREVKELVAKIEKSRHNMAHGDSYSEEDFDRMMDKLLS